MTHRLHPSVIHNLIRLLAKRGFDEMARLMRLLLNECMKLERRRGWQSGGG